MCLSACTLQFWKTHRIGSSAKGVFSLGSLCSESDSFTAAGVELSAGERTLQRLHAPSVVRLFMHAAVWLRFLTHLPALTMLWPSVSYPGMAFSSHWCLPLQDWVLGASSLELDSTSRDPWRAQPLY